MVRMSCHLEIPVSSRFWFPKAALPIGISFWSGRRWTQKNWSYIVRCKELVQETGWPQQYARKLKEFHPPTFAFIQHLNWMLFFEVQRLQGKGVELSTPQGPGQDLEKKIWQWLRPNYAQDGGTSLCFSPLNSISWDLHIFNTLQWASGILEACQNHIPFWESLVIPQRHVKHC